MIKLSLADGRRIHVNPAAIAYLEQLPDPKSGEKDRPRTKIVLTTGETLSVRQGSYQILVAAGESVPVRKKTNEAEDDGSEE